MPLSTSLVGLPLLLALAGTLATGSPAVAAELNLLIGGSLAGPMQDLVRQFEQATGHTVRLRFGTTPQLITEATGAEPFDAGIMPADVLRDPAARAAFAPGPAIPIARVGLGVAVRAGAPRPDISSVAALRQALLAARGVATIPASAGGTLTLRAFAKLGIDQITQPGLRAEPSPARLIQAVADGEAELAVFLLNVLVGSGLDVVGPFPPEIQEEVPFVAAFAAAPPQADKRRVEAARAFIAFVQGPAGIAALQARGMRPG